MHAWEAIQKTLDHIEEHLSEEIPLEQLAAIASLSPFYYQRLFSRLVKKPVREYIKLRRLAKACKRLANREVRILDVALDCGFSSHETFTRAFKTAFGCTPDQYREHSMALNQFDKPDLMLGYTMIDEGMPLLCNGLVLEFRRCVLATPIHFLGVEGFIPVAGQLPLGEATGVDEPAKVWERFHREKQRIPRIPSGRELGVAFLGDAPAGSFTYFAGAEVKPGTVAEGFTGWALPAREYVVCAFEAENFGELVTVAINKAVKYAQVWLEQHHLTMEEYSPELYPGGAPNIHCMELWMPAIPVR